MKNIEVEDILTFHRKIIEQTGGSDGIRDIGLIESSLKRAVTTFDGKDLYKEDEDKISVIAYSLIKNHGFIDGNKRIGVSVMLPEEIGMVAGQINLAAHENPGWIVWREKISKEIGS